MIWLKSHRAIPTGSENLDIINWGLRRQQNMENVYECLVQINMNDALSVRRCPESGGRHRCNSCRDGRPFSASPNHSLDDVALFKFVQRTSD